MRREKNGKHVPLSFFSVLIKAPEMKLIKHLLFRDSVNSFGTFIGIQTNPAVAHFKGPVDFGGK